MHDGSPLGLSASQTVGTAVRAVLHATMQTMLEPWEYSNLHLLRRDGNNLLPISAILVSHMLKIKRNAKENGTYIVTWTGSFAQGLETRLESGLLLFHLRQCTGGCCLPWEVICTF